MCTARSDSGSITSFVICICLVFVFCAGLVVDGSRLVGAKSEALDLAGNAARVGAQELLSIRSGGNALHPARAIAAAKKYLRINAASGMVTCDGKSVTVRVTTTVKMTILGSIGIGSRKITAVQSATPVDE